MLQNAEKDTTGIWFDMDSETNQKLEESAEFNKRTKRQEASFRLSDHLTKFDRHMPPRAKA
ncbi:MULTISPECIES: TraY domain-containing protein [Vibrio]|uniref:TraY domain-containing protein n=1 Tax=Vibrio TaxID=662 RepID=UPI0009A37FE7|nr:MULTISPECIES: TraY domain-containing protein [unclassified Vibrio]MDA0124464.1 TraY domain-containing protein [Vibrio sp. MM46]